MDVEIAWIVVVFVFFAAVAFSAIDALMRVLGRLAQAREEQ
jgi:preprotein translocase subunit SecE